MEKLELYVSLLYMSEYRYTILCCRTWKRYSLEFSTAIKTDAVLQQPHCLFSADIKRMRKVIKRFRDSMSES
jgi:hypothetical protein